MSGRGVPLAPSLSCLTCEALPAVGLASRPQPSPLIPGLPACTGPGTCGLSRNCFPDDPSHQAGPDSPAKRASKRP